MKPTKEQILKGIKTASFWFGIATLVLLSLILAIICIKVIGNIHPLLGLGFLWAYLFLVFCIVGIVSETW